MAEELRKEEPEKVAIKSIEPMVTTIPDGWRFEYFEVDPTWPVIELRNISRNRSGHIVADLDAYCSQPGAMIPVTGLKFNLSSLQTQKQMANRLKESYEDVAATWIDWRLILADLCFRAINLYRDGDEVKEIWPSDEILLPGYLIEPLLPLHQAAIVFGDGSSGKGHIAITLGIIAQLPFKDNALGLITSEDFSNVLYLDYESDEAEFQRTLTGICKGLNINVGLRRLAMAQPVADSIEQLRKRVSKDKVSFLIVDSLAPASGGNINEAEPAIKLYSALRTLPDVTTLIIAHNSKDMLTSKKSVYGSVFFTNLSRSVWECKKSQEQGDPEMLISLTHRKSNRKLHSALGFRFTFDDAINTIKVEKADLLDTELAKVLPLRIRIADLLKHRKLEVKELAEELGEKEASVRARLHDNKKIFKHFDDGWGLLINE